MKQLLNYLPILTICIIYFGFNNLYGYYHEFGIEINNYISSPEIILSFLPTIVILSGFLYSAVFQTLVTANKKTITDYETNEAREEEHDNNTSKSNLLKVLRCIANEPIFWYLGISLLLALVNYILMNIWGFKNWELQDWTLISGIINILCLLGIAYFNKGIGWIEENKIFILAVLMYLVGKVITEYRGNDAKKIKDGIAIANISFQRKGKTIKTDNNLLYIGQTQAKMFFFDRKIRSTLIYKQEEIDSLVIKNK